MMSSNADGKCDKSTLESKQPTEHGEKGATDSETAVKEVWVSTIQSVQLPSFNVQAEMESMVSGNANGGCNKSTLESKQPIKHQEKGATDSEPAVKEVWGSTIQSAFGCSFWWQRLVALSTISRVH